MDSNLTLEEMEREAYQRGEVERAALLARLADGSFTDTEELECQIEMERDQRVEAEDAIVRLQESCLKFLNSIEDAINAMDAKKALEIINEARETI